MLRTLTPDGYERVVVFDRRSGSFADIDGHILKAAATPTVSTGTFDGADGAVHERSRSRSVVFETIEGSIQQGLAELWESCCFFESVALGIAQHNQNYERSPLVVEPTRSAPGSHAAARFRLSANVFYADFSDSDNLLAVLGWNQLAPIFDTDSSSYFLRRRAGSFSYDYAWNAGAAAPTKSGNDWILNDVLSSGLLGMPCPGARLQLSGVKAATIQALRVDGSTVIASASGDDLVEMVLPGLTFYVRVLVGAGILAAPYLRVVDPGRARNQVFVNVCNCVDQTATPAEPPSSVAPVWDLEDYVLTTGTPATWILADYVGEAGSPPYGEVPLWQTVDYLTA